MGADRPDERDRADKPGRPDRADQPDRRGACGSRRSGRRARQEERRRLARELAAPQGGVVHRMALREVRINRDEVRSEIRAERWAALGRHTIVIGDPGQGQVFPAPISVSSRLFPGHPGRRTASGDGVDAAICGPPGWPARAWWALWESGAGAVLDGVSALRACGLERFEEDCIHVTLPRGSRATRLLGVQLHRPRQVQRARTAGLPRVPTEAAVVNAAQWATSDRQAALLVVMPVQQRITTGQRVLAEWRTRKRASRSAFLDLVIRDVCSGAEALGELDFGWHCRRHGIPLPSRQVVRRGARGRVYLDVWWEELAAGVEVDGVQHSWGLNRISDALRDNEVTLSDGMVLRIPVLGLRIDPDPFMAQVKRLLHIARQRR